jgi:hypothetical protein
MDEDVKKYRQYLVETEQKISDSYDKTVVTLAGGALGISFAFVEDVIGSEPVVARGALLSGWTLLTLSLAAVVLSLFFGTLAYRKAIERVGVADAVASRVKSWTATATFFLHIAAVGLLVLGLFALGCFLYQNV